MSISLETIPKLVSPLRPHAPSRSSSHTLEHRELTNSQLGRPIRRQRNSRLRPSTRNVRRRTSNERRTRQRPVNRTRHHADRHGWFTGVEDGRRNGGGGVGCWGEHGRGRVDGIRPGAGSVEFVVGCERLYSILFEDFLGI
jgi:hypothetical protein